MAKKKKKSGSRNSTSCIFEKCRIPAKTGSKVCTNHLHPLALQDEIERLRSTREGGWQDLLDQYPDLRSLGESLAELAFRAHPGRGGSIGVVTRSERRRLGPEDASGIVAVGEHRVMPYYAVGTSADSGRLGAALKAIRTTAAKLERILDPSDGPESDPRPRCGRNECPRPWTRQPFGIRFCGWCGRYFQPKGEGQVEETDMSSPSTVADPVVETFVAELTEAEDSPTDAPESADTADGGEESQVEETDEISEPTVDPQHNGSLMSSQIQGPPTRTVIVAAGDQAEAATIGLRDARAMFSSLDVRMVKAIEALEPDGDRSRWKVTVLID